MVSDEKGKNQLSVFYDLYCRVFGGTISDNKNLYLGENIWIRITVLCDGKFSCVMRE